MAPIDSYQVMVHSEFSDRLTKRIFTSLVTGLQMQLDPTILTFTPTWITAQKSAIHINIHSDDVNLLCNVI